MLAGGIDPLQVWQERLLAKILDLLLEHFGVADDGVQRRPELVGHMCQEVGFVLASNLQFATLLLHLLKQTGILNRNDGLVCEYLD